MAVDHMDSVAKLTASLEDFRDRRDQHALRRVIDDACSVTRELRAAGWMAEAVIVRIKSIAHAVLGFPDTVWPDTSAPIVHEVIRCFYEDVPV
jgi:hypothetical protein